MCFTADPKTTKAVRAKLKKNGSITAYKVVNASGVSWRGGTYYGVGKRVAAKGEKTSCDLFGTKMAAGIYVFTAVSSAKRWAVSYVGRSAAIMVVEITKGAKVFGAGRYSRDIGIALCVSSVKVTRVIRKAA